ncbi:MAG: hypothetical protein RRZ24_11775 [Clostridia bacterium]
MAFSEDEHDLAVSETAKYESLTLDGIGAALAIERDNSTDLYLRQKLDAPFDYRDISSLLQSATEEEQIGLFDVVNYSAYATSLNVAAILKTLMQ